MVNIVNKIKTFKIDDIKDFRVLLTIICLSLIVFPFIQNYKNDLDFFNTKIKLKAEYIKALKPNQIKFMKNHFFTNSTNVPEKFKKMMEEIANSCRMQILNFKKKNCLTTENNFINVIEYTIEILSWHDCYIFETLNKIQNFAPGFIKLKKIVISKVSNINLQSPSIKGLLICDLYYKKQ
jgi:hypothetical protein